MIKKYILPLIISAIIIVNLSGCSNGILKKSTASIITSSMQNKESKSKDSTGADSNKQINSDIQEKNHNKSTPETNTDIKILKDTKKNEVSKKRKVIVIDAGHGGKATLEKEPIAPGSTVMKEKDVGGAAGVSTGTPEYVVNLNVAVKLKNYLSKAGYKVIMTRTSNNESLGNIARAEVGNKTNADLVIRIHADSFTDSSAKGASMLVPDGVGYSKDISSISKKYGRIILNTLVSRVGMKSKGIITRTDLTGFNWSKVPVILIEMGFLSNPDEDRLLSSDSYQDQIAQGLFKGIQKALLGAES
ncbi:N-acetylmuramoyl-L-alanine amidase [Clostridium pascui]|uniref:N-acetylmuramoyl-L-alanine amidase family protein n=1 Tax=Clostridium pascui TaxID=46609 RepID=UPI001FAF5F46|nr:N-acetylmuramoyl-L-alanine amidase [Clostridium pascui]MBM7868557.1 N-acetylmuramoyl-L-alanine amidase [Clostridium pascui]